MNQSSAPSDVQALSSALQQAIPSSVRTISRVLSEAGYRSWIVGGCVRDVALTVLHGARKRQAADWDMATDAEPQAVQKLFRRVIPTGIEHGTVTIVLGGEHFEVTTLRGEKGHTDGRRPDEVFFVSDLKEDLARRDFTVNAMAFEVASNTFADPFFGLQDLQKRVLRAVGEPRLRFSEDGLRVLRGARFCATLAFELEKETAAAIVPTLAVFERVAQERVRDEWLKALSSEHPSRFLQAIFEHQMLHITAPEIFEKGATPTLPFELTQQRLDQSKAEPFFRLALLLSAGLKQQANLTKQLQVASQEAQKLATRLRLSKEEAAHLKLLCAHHALPAAWQQQLPASATDAQTQAQLESTLGPQLRRYLAEIGRENLSEVCELQLLCDDKAQPSLQQLHQLLEKEAASDAALTLKELKVGGKELISAGVNKGPQLGNCLQMLLAAVLDEPSLNDKEKLLALVQEAAQESAQK